GDVTTVATQYSAVPSWIGFIIDSQTTINQNRATIDAVVERWKQLSEDQRPTLVLFGESLGSMGTQGAWTADATPEEVTEDIKSIIWIGPPAESTLWKSWQADRTSGPAWDPVIGDGQITRVLVETEDPDRDDDTRLPVIVFAAHANDPVVYWRPDLFYREADWTIPPHGPGVMSSLRWFPFITGFQVGMDLISGGAPPEVGHNYSADMAPAVVLGVANPEWNPGDTVRLQEALPDFRYETG
ncbi:MAG: alpha/beta-hydrolase family protein, partial [Actinomycetia bacterium]|nr:alpha/beta-hydrolase family protein [Actinomycetes bacterium]